MKTPSETPGPSATRAPGNFINTLGRIGRFVGTRLSLPGLGATRAKAHRGRPGTTPGIESMLTGSTPPAEGEIQMQATDYGLEETRTESVTDLSAWLKTPRPDWSRVRWLNVNGLHPHVVEELRQHFGFHSLAAEDVVRVPQRPKLEEYDSHLFIVMRMLMWKEDRLHSEQVSLFLFGDTLLTFQEAAGDVWDPIRQRIQRPGSRLRQHDASYLLYALLDAVVDHCFPILEAYGDILEALEKEVMLDPAPEVQQRIHWVKRELASLRRVLWPTREVANALQREETEGIAAPVRIYMRDVYDHAVQVMDILETFRENASGLNDLYMSSVSNRMNEIMKVLTIMASFFIPITFIAGVFGMNFEHIPELHWKYGYLGFWIVCLTVSGFLAVFFYRKRWIGRG
jgi:magnesium transporter